MSRIGLAFSSFFRLLFGKKLSPAVADYLPPEVARLPAGDAPPPKAAKPEPKPEPRPEPVAKKVDLSAAQRDGALALLALLQRDGRLVDFLREPLDGFADADIGAAARDVHRGCKQGPRSVLHARAGAAWRR
jgi:hypothetical protein